MKTVRVVAAVICDDMQHPGRIFAAARGYGDQKGGWEFPGGKVEPGETGPEALIREIREELDAGIEVGALLHTIEYDYPAFHLSMACYLCQVKQGKLILKEAEAARWLTEAELESINWLPSDRDLLPILHRIMK